MSRLARFRADQRGAAAAEFAMVLPVALLFMLGIIDVGRYFWALNRLEKAVQVGVRYAVPTDIVPSGLNATSFVDFECGGVELTPGSKICRDALGKITCGMSGGAIACTCTPNKDADNADIAGSCPEDMDTLNSDAFTRMVNRMRMIDQSITPANVQISYMGSGLGFAGDPKVDDDGDKLSEISPVVMVEVASVRFRSMSLLGAGITLPGFRYSQTLEDGDGAVAY